MKRGGRDERPLEFYASERPLNASTILSEGPKPIGADDLNRAANKSELERSWKEFIGWVGYFELLKALDRKTSSIDQTSLRLASECIFSIEIGLSRVAKRWSTLRKLAYPKDSCVYNAYSFVHSCIALKRTLPPGNIEQLKQRIISNILPSGRLADIDLELQIWRTLHRSSDDEIRFGVLGTPGPDFVISGAGFEIEIEAKCISPETGMPLSYGLVSSLMRDIHGHMRQLYPNQFVTIEAEVTTTHPTNRAVAAFKAQIEQTYALGKKIVTPELITTISFRPLEEVTAEFGSIAENSSKLFGKYRRQYGDFGLLTGDETECLFLNLIPLSPDKTLKKIKRIISEAGDQLSKKRPGILWLHFLGLPDTQSESEDEDMLNFFDRLLDHAFSPRRDHVSIVVFSSDTQLIDRKTRGRTRSVRAADGKNHKRFYANPHARFPVTEWRRLGGETT